jgi:hypothetical protein
LFTCSLGEFGEEEEVENGGIDGASLGALIHGGRKEAWSFKLCVLVLLLGGGRTCGERA